MTCSSSDFTWYECPTRLSVRSYHLDCRCRLFCATSARSSEFQQNYFPVTLVPQPDLAERMNGMEKKVRAGLSWAWDQESWEAKEDPPHHRPNHIHQRSASVKTCQRWYETFVPRQHALSFALVSWSRGWSCSSDMHVSATMWLADGFMNLSNILFGHLVECYYSP